jgi:hypothetical protein
MAYTTKAQVQNYLLITINSSFDTQITEWITAIKKWIDTYCDRTFEQESATYKLYDGDGENELLIDDLLTLSKIEILDEDGSVDYTIDDTTEYYLYPANDTPKTSIKLNKYNAPVSVFLKGEQNIKVTGTFGYAATVPEDIRLVATKLVAQIVQDSGTDVTADISAERLGEYSVNFDKIGDMADFLGVKIILDMYRVLKV